MLRQKVRTNTASLVNMTVHKLCVLWVMTVLHHAETSLLSTREDVWRTDKDFANLTVRGDVPTVWNVTSVLACIRHCLKHDACSTVFYNSDLQACKVCRQPCGQTLLPYPGFRCFRSRKIPKCSLPPEVPYASPSHAIGYYGDNVTYSCQPGAVQYSTDDGRRTCNQTGGWSMVAGAKDPSCAATFPVGGWVRVMMTSLMDPHMVFKNLFPGVIGYVADNSGCPIYVEFPYMSCSATPCDKYELLPGSHFLLQTTCTVNTDCLAYPKTVCLRGRCICDNGNRSIFNEEIEKCV